MGDGQPVLTQIRLSGYCNFTGHDRLRPDSHPPFVIALALQAASIGVNFSENDGPVTADHQHPGGLYPHPKRLLQYQ